MPETKVCMRCDLPKLLEDFRRTPKGKYGRRSVCKSCETIDRKLAREQNGDRMREQYREWQKANPEKVRQYRDRYRFKYPERVKKSAAEQRGKNPDYQPKYHLMAKYGITLDEYDAMFESQNGVCAICGRKQTGGRRLDIDHDHRTGKIRGLLCNRCNQAIGLIGDSSTQLMKAAIYLMGRNK